LETELALEAKALEWEKVWGWAEGEGVMLAREEIVYVLPAVKRCPIRRVHLVPQ